MKSLANAQNVKEYMSQATSEDDWNNRCDHVKAANNNDYPSFWFSAIILSGLAAKTKKTWQ